MNIGIHDLPFIRHWPSERFFEEVSRVGYDCVEINVLEGGGYLGLHTPPGEASRAAGRCRELGIRIASVSTNLHNVYALSSADYSRRRHGEYIALKMIELAAAAGARVVQIVPGVACPDTPYDRACALARETLARLAAEAAAAGVVIGIENVANHFLSGPAELARFVRELDSPAVGIYFDTGNARAGGYPEQWLRTVGPLLVNVHVKDYRPVSGEYAAALAGAVDWPAVMRELRRASYKGDLILTPPPYTYCPERLLEASRSDMLAILSLQAAGGELEAVQL